MKYKRKSKTVEAVQFDGTAESVGKIFNELGVDSARMDYSFDQTNIAVVGIPEKIISTILHLNEYLVKLPNNKYKVMTPNEFNEKYSPVNSLTFEDWLNNHIENQLKVTGCLFDDEGIETAIEDLSNRDLISYMSLYLEDK